MSIMSFQLRAETSVIPLIFGDMSFPDDKRGLILKCELGAQTRADRSPSNPDLGFTVMVGPRK